MSKLDAKASTNLKNYLEGNDDFESRKRDHIQHSLSEESQASGKSDFEKVQLIYDSLPNIDLDKCNLEQSSLAKKIGTPFYVSAMTAGHKDSEGINHRIAKACAQTGWTMMLGSQRGELNDKNKANEWKMIRQEFPGIDLIGNIGLSQISELSLDQVGSLLESTGAIALAVHCNPLQEALQPEGTTQFSGSLEALARLCEQISTSVILKETGSGFSRRSLEKVKDFKLAAIDISGLGGTHWGRIEGMRSPENSRHRVAAEVFKNFGVSSLQSMENANELNLKSELWGSGGVRNGLDAAKLLAMGAKRVGMAQPILRAAMESTEAVISEMESFEFQLKIAMFCTGSESLDQLKGKYLWTK